MVQPEWHAMLEQSVRQGPDRDNWLAWYHLGVMRFRSGDSEGARAAYERSIELEPSAWAWRDLAVLAREAGNAGAAPELWLRASHLAPALAPLAIECGSALLAAGRTGDLLAFIASLPPRLQSHGRIRLLAARASLAMGDLDAVERYFEQEPDLATVREKETALSDLWFALQEMRLARQRQVPIDDALRREVRQHFPPPEKFDFRLNAEQS
jgi:tetratricopeptide (TPR) repeat protein